MILERYTIGVGDRFAHHFAAGGRTLFIGFAFRHVAAPMLFRQMMIYRAQRIHGPRKCLVLRTGNSG